MQSLFEYYAFMLNFVAGAYMMGVILFVQLVHYPIFLKIKDSEFLAFHKQHSNWTTVVVLIPMFVELASATWLLLYSDQNFVFLMTLGTWLSTFLLSVPLHKKLENGREEKVIRQLIYTNWPRTIMWSVKTIYMLTLFIRKESVL